jgi:hypothetical protein
LNKSIAKNYFAHDYNLSAHSQFSAKINYLAAVTSVALFGYNSDFYDLDESIDEFNENIIDVIRSYI